MLHTQSGFQSVYSHYKLGVYVTINSLHCNKKHGLRSKKIRILKIGALEKIFTSPSVNELLSLLETCLLAYFHRVRKLDSHFY